MSSGSSLGNFRSDQRRWRMNVVVGPSRRELFQAEGSVAITALAGATGQAAEPSKAVTAGSQSRLKRIPRVKPEDIRLDSRRLQLAYKLLEKGTARPGA